MSRSLKKGPFIDPRIVKKIQNMPAGSKQSIKTWARDAVITPEMVGYNFGVHNGKEHINVFIIEDMVGHKLGEFSPTRKFRRHGGRMAKEQDKGAPVAESTTKKE
ncbi:MAG: 30S ribosomal protein S19 [Patescibacteria group bacterium]